MIKDMLASLKQEPENWAMVNQFLTNDKRKVSIVLYKNERKTVGTVMLDGEDTWVELGVLDVRKLRKFKDRLLEYQVSRRLTEPV